MNDEEILIRMGLDASSVKTGLEEVKHTVADSLKGIAGLFGAAFGVEAIVEKVGEFFKEIVEGARSINEMSIRLDTSIEKIQQLGFAAKTSSVDMETVAGAIDHLSKAKEAALAGGAEGDKMQKLFADFGISITDIQKLDSVSLFERIGDSIAKTGANAQVTAESMNLMGRSAGQLIPMLKDLSEKERGAVPASTADVQTVAHAGEDISGVGYNLKSGATTLTAAGLRGAYDLPGMLRHPIDTTVDALSGFFNQGGMTPKRQMEINDRLRLQKDGHDFDHERHDEPDLPQTAAEKKAAEEHLAVEKKITDELNKQKDVQTDQNGKEETLATIKQKLYDIGKKMAALNPDPGEYTSSPELDSLRLQAAILSGELPAAQAAADEKATKLSDRISKNQAELAQQDFEAPSIEDLAGRKWSARLAKQYGKGGEFDLGAGDGPLAATAQEYELAKKQQIWDRTYGNKEDAENDRTRMINAQNFLIDAGAASPTMQLDKIREATTAMQDQLTKLITGGAHINTHIVSVDD